MFNWNNLTHAEGNDYISSLRCTDYFGDCDSIVDGWRFYNEDSRKWVFLAAHMKAGETRAKFTKKPECIVLLSKMDFDPLGVHNNPYMIDLIYTDPEKRRTGLGSNIVKHILNEEDLNYSSFQLIAVASSEDSEKLFESLGFIKKQIIGDNPIYYSQ